MDVVAKALTAQDAVVYYDTDVKDDGDSNQRQALVCKAFREATGSPLRHVALIPTYDECSLDTLSTVHRPVYVNFLKRAYEEGSRDERASRYFPSNAEDRKSLVLGVAPKTLPSAWERGTLEPHLRTLPVSVAMGYFAADCSSPIYSQTYHQAATSAQNSVLAARFLLKHPELVVCAVNRSPGHHAFLNQYARGCFFNNAMLAANALMYGTEPKVRVGILDLDAYAGNGTDSIVWNVLSQRVASVSVHLDPALGYPTYSGFGAFSTGRSRDICIGAKTVWNPAAATEGETKTAASAIAVVPASTTAVADEAKEETKADHKQQGGGGVSVFARMAADARGIFGGHRAAVEEEKKKEQEVDDLKQQADMEAKLDAKGIVRSYSQALKLALDLLTGELKCDYLVIAFGSNTYKGDASGVMALEVEDYRKMGAMIRQRMPQAPIMVTQEGGDSDKVGDIMVEFVRGLLPIAAPAAASGGAAAAAEESKETKTQ